jgi:hypothetical protein
MATLGLIAGSGRLPFEIAEGARQSGLRLAILALEGETDLAIEALADRFTRIAVGELETLLGFFKQAGASEVILAGGVGKPELLRDPARLRPDARALALLARLRDRGDDALLRAVARELESEGLPVVESTKYLGRRLTHPGPIAGPEPTAEQTADLRLGLRVAYGLGLHDVGQTVVVKRGTVLAVEAIEGTDAALRRGAELGGPGVVVVKAAKPHQDLRFDVPVIGPDTLELGREYGIGAVGLEAGRTLMLERARCIALAEKSGISLVGLAGETGG